VRVPIPIVVALCLAVVSGVWWLGSRDYDFLSPPAEERLAAVRAGAQAEPDRDADGADETTPPPEIPPGPSPVKVRIPGESETPRLADHVALAGNHPERLPVLASSHESAGNPQRAWLAHERIIDSTPATEDQLADSIQAVLRLRAMLPPWIADPEIAHGVILHVGTAEAQADHIAPFLDEVAGEMTKSASGIVTVLPRIHRGRDIPIDSASPPVAVWLTGPDDDSPGTAVLSFTLGADDDPLAVISQSVLRLLRAHTSATTTLKIPAPPPDADFSIQMVFAHVTRLVWHELGIRFNPENQ